MNALREFWDSVPPILKNKYALVSIGFLFWLLFLDSNNLSSQFSINKQLNDLEKQKVTYAKEIETTNEALDELLHDEATQEKFAREQYLMKKEDEDVYIIMK